MLQSHAVGSSSTCFHLRWYFEGSEGARSELGLVMLARLTLKTLQRHWSTQHLSTHEDWRLNLPRAYL